MTTSSFETYNIKHLSPSSLYTWMAQPSLWVMERLLGHRGSVGCAAHRGTAVEAGIAAGLLNPEMPMAECHDIAIREFDTKAALSADPKREKERAGIPNMVTIGLEELRQYGKPSSTQGFVKHSFDGLAVPILGYFDFEWAEHGVIADLKTTYRVPGEPSTSHCRQVALYIHGRNFEGRLAYTSDKKIAVYRVDNAQKHVADLVNIAQRLGRFLALSADPMELASLLTPDLDTFWWSDPTTRLHAERIYGL